MRSIVLVLLTALAVIGCSPGASSSPPPTPSPSASTHTVTGTLTLGGCSDCLTTVTGGCAGTNGFDDLQAGAPVTLRDQNNTILGATTLGNGQGGVGECVFSFTLPNIPDTPTFYDLSISHRGDISKSHADLAAANWAFALSIGQ